MNTLSSSVEVGSFDEAIEFIYAKGWTDGLPVIPATPERVTEFLEYVGLEPDAILGELPERDRVIHAEKLAVNAIMAGCKKEYLPVLIAAVEAISEPRFRFNHLASMGSPAPILILGGPIVNELGFNYERGVMGPSPARANATVGRALSLLLWNCAEWRPDRVQRGTYGNPLRWASCCIAENPNETGWTTLREDLGFEKHDSTVTVVSISGGYTDVWTKKPDPVDTLMSIADAIVTGGGNFNRGVYVVLMAPPIVDRLAKQGWDRQAARSWLLENAGWTIAGLKRRGRWGLSSPDVEGFPAGISSTEADQNDDRYVRLFKSNGALDHLLWDKGQIERDADVYIVATGGDVSARTLVMAEYALSTNPVTKKIRPATSRPPIQTADAMSGAVD